MNLDFRTLISGKNQVLVIGAGRSGIAATKLLLKHKVPVSLFDDNQHEKLRFFKDCDLKESSLLRTYFGGTFPELENIKAVILSPGVNPDHQLVRWGKINQVPTISEIDLAVLYLPGQKMIGVTGTNGKSTTTAMLENILNCAGFKAVACGNIGLPLCEVAIKEQVFDYLVVELSSFQLEVSSLIKLLCAIIVNITPDHLDRHKSFNDYVNAKLKIASLLKDDGILVINRSLSPFIMNPGLQHVWFDAKNFGVDNLAFLENTSIVGHHNQENAMAATVSACQLGINEQHILAGLNTFKPLPHRCELVGIKNGITFINDSKGTTVEAVKKALTMYPAPTHLLLGGIEKGEDFSPLKAFFNVKGYYVYGQAKAKILADLNSSLATDHSNLEAALKAACIKAQAGDVVILSPGCASYDQFDDYYHRGETFKKLVMEI